MLARARILLLLLVKDLDVPLKARTTQTVAAWEFLQLVDWLQTDWAVWLRFHGRIQLALGRCAPLSIHGHGVHRAVRL